MRCSKEATCQAYVIFMYEEKYNDDEKNCGEV
jgi:hypothetical protein